MWINDVHASGVHGQLILLSATCGSKMYMPEEFMDNLPSSQLHVDKWCICQWSSWTTYPPLSYLWINDVYASGVHGQLTLLLATCGSKMYMPVEFMDNLPSSQLHVDKWCICQWSSWTTYPPLSYMWINDVYANGIHGQLTLLSATCDQWCTCQWSSWTLTSSQLHVDQWCTCQWNSWTTYHPLSHMWINDVHASGVHGQLTSSQLHVDQWCTCQWSSWTTYPPLSYMWINDVHASGVHGQLVRLNEVFNACQLVDQSTEMFW